MCSGRNLDWVNAFAGIAMPSWTHRLIAFGREPAPVKTFAIEQDEDNVFVLVGEQD